MRNFGLYLSTITGKGRSYFTRKHALCEMRRLGLLDGLSQRVADKFEADSLSEICEICRRSGYTPIVAFVKDEQADLVFKGAARVTFESITRHVRPSDMRRQKP